MRNSTRIALFVSLFFLIGFPMIFMIISMFTDQWIYLFSGSVPSMLGGAAGIYYCLEQSKKTGRKDGLPHDSAAEDENQ